MGLLRCEPETVRKIAPRRAEQGAVNTKGPAPSFSPCCLLCLGPARRKDGAHNLTRRVDSRQTSTPGRSFAGAGNSLLLRKEKVQTEISSQKTDLSQYSIKRHTFCVFISKTAVKTLL